MTKYETSLKQICQQCKTKPQNCNKNKCVRYNNMRELVERDISQNQVVEKLKKVGISKKLGMVLEKLGLYDCEEEIEGNENESKK